MRQRNPNKIDQAAKLLREQLHELDREAREIQRAKDKILKMLAIAAPKDSELVGRAPRQNQGPIRKDSTNVLWNAIRTNFAPDFEIPYRKIEEVGVAAGLRPGQANGAVTTLYRQGRLTRPRHAHYTYTNGQTKEVKDGDK